jgi:HK97 family phage prohead protease
MLERKDLRAAWRSADPPGRADGTAETVGLEGHASLWDIPDQGGDVVERGACAASLRRLRAEGRAVRMLWQHDAAQPIGVWDEVEEDARGLRVKGRLLLSVGRGREAWALVRAGALDGLSIGYRTLRASKDARGGRRLHEIDLWEVSLVTFPMLRAARLGAKRATLGEMTLAVAAARRRLIT